MEFLKDNMVLTLLAILAFVLVLASRTTQAETFVYGFEGFDAPASVVGTGVPVEELKQEEIVARPPYLDHETGTIMSGSGFLPPREVIPPWGEVKYGDLDPLDDGESGNYGLHFNMVSPACCSDQWPTPHKLPYEKEVCGNKDKFATTPYFGQNSWQNSGCVCVTENQRNFLVNRGGNVE